MSAMRAAVPHRALAGSAPARVLHQQPRLFHAGFRLSSQPPHATNRRAAQTLDPFKMAVLKRNALPPPQKKSMGRLFLSGALSMLGFWFAVTLGYAAGAAYFLAPLGAGMQAEKAVAQTQAQYIIESDHEGFANVDVPGKPPLTPVERELLKERLAETRKAIAGQLDQLWHRADSLEPALEEVVDPVFQRLLPTLRDNTMLTGILNTPNGLPAPIVVARPEGGGRCIMAMYVGKDMCGHDGIVHGGFLATAFDEAMARACFPQLPGGMGVTASLEVDYHAPVRTDCVVYVVAHVVKVEGRRAKVHAFIGSSLTDPKEPLASARADFAAPRSMPNVKPYLDMLGLTPYVGL